MTDVNIQERNSAPTKLNAGAQKVCKKRIHHGCLVRIERKIRPSGSLFGITWQSLVKPTVTPDGFLHPHPTLIKDSYNIKRSFRTDWSGRTVLTPIRLGSSLIKVSTVRHSIYIILINNFIENPYLSNLRVINAFFFFFFFFFLVSEFLGSLRHLIRELRHIKICIFQKTEDKTSLHCATRLSHLNSI